MEADSYEGKALEAQALHDMEFMRETDRRGDGTGYTCRSPKTEPYRLATIGQLDELRGLLPALDGVRALLKRGCDELAIEAMYCALGYICVALKRGIDEIDNQRAK